MRNVDGHLGTATNAGAFDAMRAAARPVSWSMTAVAEPQKFSDFEALLLAIAGHDLPQPLQAIQSAQELLGNGVRTRSGLHHLASNQIAINRLTEQLDQLIAALRLREHAGDIELSAICLEPLLGQAGRENEAAALRKRIEIRTVSTSASIMSDPLLLGAVLRNLVGNAVNIPNPAVALSWAAAMLVATSASTSSIGAAASRKSKCRKSSTPSAVLTISGVTGSASASSSYAKQSACSDIVSR